MKHVAVLMGGLSAERSVSLRSGAACALALEGEGYRVSRVDVDRDLSDALTHLKPDVAFNALHGRFGEDGVVQGPLIEPAAVDKVKRHLKDALDKGAKLVTGGQALQGQFFQPTVVAHATPDMACAKEETFGPFAPVFKFKTEQDVIDMANNTEYGLASYFYSRDVGRIFRVSEALEYGMVGINVGIIATEHVPFGGVKQSGLGREGSSHGMDEYLEMKYLCVGDVLK